MEGVSSKERELIRNEIASMSFEDLQKLKEKIGSKLYNETIFGKSEKKNTNFKRVNKNRPREESSKKQFRFVKGIVSTNSITSRDPRFDPLCGSFDKRIFQKHYKFVSSIKQNEKLELEKELKSCEDPERKEKIKFLLQRIGNQLREQKKQEKLHDEALHEKKDIKEKLSQGIKPEFKKKSEKKIENLVDKYEELRKTNRLKKHIERRSKKLANKDREKMKWNKEVD